MEDQCRRHVAEICRLQTEARVLERKFASAERQMLLAEDKIAKGGLTALLAGPGVQACAVARALCVRSAQLHPAM